MSHAETQGTQRLLAGLEATKTQRHQGATAFGGAGTKEGILNKELLEQMNKEQGIMNGEGSER